MCVKRFKNWIDQCVNTYKCVYICIHIFMYMYIYIYINIFVYIPLSLYIYISFERAPYWCESVAFRYTCMVAPSHLLCAFELLVLFSRSARSFFKLRKRSPVVWIFCIYVHFDGCGFKTRFWTARWRLKYCLRKKQTSKNCLQKMKTWKNCSQKMKTTFKKWRSHSLICLTAHAFFSHVCKRGMTSHTYICMNTHIHMHEHTHAFRQGVQTTTLTWTN